MSRDLIPSFARGKIITGASLEQVRIAATQQHGGHGSFVDGTGTFQRSMTRRERGVWFKPNADVPARGVMYVTGIDDTQGELVMTTKKPDGIALGEILMVNGPEDVASGAYAKGFMFGDIARQALVNSAETVANGDVCGPKSGSWELWKDFPGLIAFAAKDADNLAWVRLDPDPTMDIELKDAMPSSGSVAAGQQATAYRLQPDGDVDTSVEVEVFDERGEFRGKAYVSGANRGSKGVAYWHREKDRIAIRTLQPHALRISGAAGADVYYDDTEFTLSGTPEIMNPSGALAMEDLTTSNLIKNPLDLQFASGDIVQAEWNEDASTPQWEAVDVGVPRPHRISGTAGSDVYAATAQFTLSGTPVIMNPIDAISEEDYTASNLIKNPLGLVFESGTKVHAEWNDSASQWEAVDGGGATHPARWLIGTATSDFLTAPATIAINSSPTYKDGLAPAADPSVVANDLGLTGNSGAKIYALHDGDGTYSAVNVSHVAETFVTEVTVNGTTFKLQNKTRPHSIMPRGAESSLTDIHTGTDCS